VFPQREPDLSAFGILTQDASPLGHRGIPTDWRTDWLYGLVLRNAENSWEWCSRSAWDAAELKLADGQTTFEFAELVPGDYFISLQSKPVRSKEHEGMFTLRSIGSRRIQLKPGETKNVKF